MIVHNEIEVYPVDVEEAIYMLPGISELQVFGFPDPNKGQEVAIWIKLKEDSQLSLESIATHVQEQLPVEKYPKYYKFVSEFPMTGSGKVQKFRMTGRCKMINSNDYKTLSPKELFHWMEENKNFCLIDTLMGDHFRRIHLPNATNACVFEVTFIDQVKAMTEDKDAEIVLYGSSTRSMDASKAAEKLAQQGYGHINVLRGGIEAWRSAGLALEGEAVDEPDNPQTLLKLEDPMFRTQIRKVNLIIQLQPKFLRLHILAKVCEPLIFKDSLKNVPEWGI